MKFSIPFADQDGYFFLGNLTDLEISDISGESVRVTLTARYDAENTYVLDETYVPDNAGKVKLYDVKSIVEPLFPDSISNGIPSFGLDMQPTVSLYVEATDGAGTKSEMYRSIFSKGKVDAIPSDFCRFYTQMRNRKCHWRNLQTISFPANRKCSLGIAYMSSEGMAKYQKEIIMEEEYGIRTMNISAAELMTAYGLGKARDCLYVEALLLDTDGTTVRDRVFVEFDRTGAAENYTTFLFSNFFGVPETMAMQGVPTEEIVVDSNLAYFGRQLAKYDSDIYVRTTARTGHLDAEGFKQLTDLVQSTTLYEIAEGSPVRIVIEDTDIRRNRISRTIQSASITYLTTEKWERSAFMADMATSERIFDDSFDDTFN